MSIFPYYYDSQTRKWVENDFFRRSSLLPYWEPLSLAHYDLDFFKPWHWDNWLSRPWDHFWSPLDFTSAIKKLRLEAGSIHNDGDKFHIRVDVHHFAPEEITVKVKDGFVVIEARHHEKKDHHGFVTREFMRKYSLPAGCLPDTVTSRLSSDGVLTITAPNTIALPSPGERIVPMTCTGPAAPLRRYSFRDYPRIEEVN